MKRVKANMVIPQDIMTIQSLFSQEGKKLYIVGGAVRDFLLNKEPNDFDLVTDAIPNEVINILKDYNTDLQGAHFGVVRVFTEDEPEGHEIASFRTDISHGRDNKGDDQKVEIGNHITIEDDVKRRDLTINALFYDIETNEIVDLVDGIEDLENGVIQTVGKASERFEEDRLRILRAIRFSATMNYRLHGDTLTSIIVDNKLFGISEKDDVSRERIIAEFIKVEEKTKGKPQLMRKYFDMLLDFGILEQVFPNIDIDIFFNATDSLTLTLAHMFKNNKINKDFIKVLKDAKLPNKMINHIVGLLPFMYGVDKNNIVELKRTQKSKNITDDMISSWMELCGLSENNFRDYNLFELTVSGEDVMADGFKGKEITDEINRREGINFMKHIGIY